MKIVVLDGFTLNPGDNSWAAVEKVGDLTVYERTATDKIMERALSADVVITNKAPLTAATLRQLPKLKFISVLATGYNNIDVQTARQRNIPVSNVPIYGTDSVAQFTFALLLELCHHVGLHDEQVKGGAWTSNPDFSFWKVPLIELAGKTIGIVGFGRIGRRVGEIAHALGMQVVAFDATRGNEPRYRPFQWAAVDVLFREADVVSLHCPQTADNIGFVNKALLLTMKPLSFLINTARGALIDEADLAAALNQGTLAGAACDVVSTEPIPVDHPLLRAKNCLITPHIAWATLESRQRMMQATAENVAAFAQGRPINVVN